MRKVRHIFPEKNSNEKIENLPHKRAYNSHLRIDFNEIKSFEIQDLRLFEQLINSYWKKYSGKEFNVVKVY